MKRKINKVKHNDKLPLFTIIIAIVIFMLTYAYSAFSDQLTITGMVGKVRIDKVVRVNAVSTQSGYVSDLDYSHSSIISEISVPANDSITYSVTVNNLGNTPMAVAGVSFTNLTGQEITGLSANINDSNYIKICNTNNVCTVGAEKTFDVTITNNTNNRINQNIRAVLLFTEVYSITYSNNVIGETIANHSFTHTFQNNAPTNVVLEGAHNGFTYQNNILTIQNVNSNITVYNAYEITYEGKHLDMVSPGATYTKTFENFPKSIQVQGTYGNYTYQNHTLTITNVGSNITLEPIYGEIYISNITRISAVNVARDDPPTFDGMSATFDIKFKKDENSQSDDFEIVYEVQLTNEYYENYVFRGFDFNPIIHSAADSDTAILHLEPIGVQEGEIIGPETTKTFRIRLWLEASNPDGSYTVEAETGVDTIGTSGEETGEITATISPLTGDLRSPLERATFTLSVTSTYESAKEFRVLSSNTNLQLVDANNNALGNLTINGESTQTYTIYIRKHPQAAFLQTTATTDITVSPTGMPNIAVDTLTFNVDKFVGVDTTKVTVANAVIDYNRTGSDNIPTVGGVKVTWERIDEGGTPISDYVVLLYRSGSNAAPVEGHTNSGVTTYTFENTSRTDGTYYAIVYGIDGGPNSGAEDVPNAQQAPGYATRSADKTFKWRYTVDTSGVTNLAVGGDGATAYYEHSHTITVTASGSSNGYAYTAPESVTVKMGGTTLTQGTDYTYGRSGSNNTIGTIKILKVTGNIEITAARAGGCLIEGTKVLLANGEYKNVENINYDDLLLTYSYETGEFIPEYPIWIEKGKKTDEYQRTTFSDGTIFETYSYHALYDIENKKFVSVDNPKEFHVGTKVAKMKKDGSGFEELTVTKIEQIHEIVNYYQVISTRYFNIIGNDLLVTDGIVQMSNVYGFNDNITWIKENREEAIKDVFTYDELKDYLPHYLFKGLRAEEVKQVIKSGFGMDKFAVFVGQLTNQKDMRKEPFNQLGKTMWMVTTSEDNVNDLNKQKYLRYENSTYELPKSKKDNFVGWLNATDNKIYKPGDKITVYHSIYFKAIYK